MISCHACSDKLSLVSITSENHRPMSTPAKLLPPAQPSYVFRGHGTAVHAVAFSPSNHRLLTADATGWIVSWSLATRRPAAAWRAHTDSVLGVAWWGLDAVLS